VECILTRPELQPERLVDGEPDHAQRDVERTKDDCCPGSANLVPIARHETHHQQRHARDDVQQVVPRVRGVERRHLDAQPVEQHEQRAVQQQPHAEDDDV
jgi:hypothetical protein